MVFVTPYNGKNLKVQYKDDLPSLTEQCYKDECDIGIIIERYVKTGQLPNSDKALSYKDCTSVKDYQDAMYLLADCKSAFESLPAVERDRFKTVENYLEFVSNPANLKESYEKGYINPDTVDIADVYPERIAEVSPPFAEQPTQTATTESVAE